MKEELRTQTVEIQKLRNNNRVLLGENLMLKQQQVTKQLRYNELCKAQLHCVKNYHKLRWSFKRGLCDLENVS